MKKTLSIFIIIGISFITLLGLFLGIAVLGKNEALTTQIGTIFYFFLIPFVVVLLLAFVLIELIFIIKKSAGKFTKIHFGVSVLTLCLLVGQILHFSSIVKENDGEYSLLKGLQLKEFLGHNAPDEQVVYANRDGKELKISVYNNKTFDQPNQLRPVYVYVHGGGWVSGNSETHSAFHRKMADAGYVGFSINYRLANRGKTDNPTWDKTIVDVAEAMQWIKNNAEKYGGDPNRIVLSGESAGGNLALIYAGSVAQGKIDGVLPEFVAVIFPAIGIEWIQQNARFFTTQTLPYIIESYIGGNLEDYPERVQAISPLNFVSKNLPPTLIIHGEKDTMVSVTGSEEYHQQLTALGVLSKLVVLPYCNHGIDMNVNHSLILDFVRGESVK